MQRTQKLSTLVTETEPEADEMHRLEPASAVGAAALQIRNVPPILSCSLRVSLSRAGFET